MLDNSIIDDYKKTGVVIIRKCLIDCIDAVIKDVARLMQDGTSNEDFFHETSIDNKNSIVRRVERCTNYIDTSAIDAVIDGIVTDLAGYKPSIFKDKINLKYSGSNKFAHHIDGHFYWKAGDVQKNGWEEYASNFINIVVPLDTMSHDNGCLLVADKRDTLKIFGSYDFKDIVEQLPNSNSPYISEKDTDKVDFKPMLLEPGDIAVFDWKCIHGSKDNDSSSARRVFYLTYNNINEGKNRAKYYLDKELSSSSRSSKALN